MLTPICKAYCSDNAFKVADLAMQTHGGYGYCQEYPVEQYARDIKITSIYEGTNGVQAMDLLGRKLPMKGGQVMMGFVAEINDRVAALKKSEATSDLAVKLTDALGKVQGVIMKFMGLSKEKSAMALVPFINACDLLEMLGDFLIGFLLTEEAAVADGKLKAIFEEKGASDAAAQRAVIKESSEALFYNGKIKTADFFVNMLLPRVAWKEASIMNMNTSCLENVFPTLVD